MWQLHVFRHLEYAIDKVAWADCYCCVSHAYYSSSTTVTLSFGKVLVSIPEMSVLASGTVLLFQGGGTPMFAVLRFSFSVKVHGQAKIGLDLWLSLKIMLDSCPISSKFLWNYVHTAVCKNIGCGVQWRNRCLTFDLQNPTLTFDFCFYQGWRSKYRIYWNATLLLFHTAV